VPLQRAPSASDQVVGQQAQGLALHERHRARILELVHEGSGNILHDANITAAQILMPAPDAPTPQEALRSRTFQLGAPLETVLCDHILVPAGSRLQACRLADSQKFARGVLVRALVADDESPRVVLHIDGALYETAPESGRSSGPGGSPGAAPRTARSPERRDDVAGVPQHVHQPGIGKELAYLPPDQGIARRLLDEDACSALFLGDPGERLSGKGRDARSETVCAQHRVEPYVGVSPELEGTPQPIQVVREEVGLPEASDLGMLGEHAVQPGRPAARTAQDDDELQMSDPRHCARTGRVRANLERGGSIPVRRVRPRTMSESAPPVVSVVVPTCARTDRLRQALASIRDQSLGEWDCWVVNDSPAEADQVEALIRELGDERFHLISNPAQVGPSASRNAGIAASSGAILAFLDDDDRWTPGKLKWHVAEHRRCGVPAVVYSQAAHVWEGELFRPFRLAPGLPPDDIVEAIREERFWPGGPPVVTISRTCFDEVGGFDAELPCREDQELMLRLAKRFPFYYVPKLTVLVTEHVYQRASIDLAHLIAGLERLGPSWGVPQIRQRHWIRNRVLMYELIARLDASLWQRLSRLREYGRLARPPEYGWIRWAWWGLRAQPSAALRLCGLAVGGRAFCWLNRRRRFRDGADADLRAALSTPCGRVQ